MNNLATGQTDLTDARPRYATLQQPDLVVAAEAMVTKVTTASLLTFVKSTNGAGITDPRVVLIDLRTTQDRNDANCRIRGAISHRYEMTDNGRVSFDALKQNQINGPLQNWNNLPGWVIFCCSVGSARSPEMAVRYAYFLKQQSVPNTHPIRVAYVGGGMTAYKQLADLRVPPNPTDAQRATGDGAYGPF